MPERTDKSTGGGPDKDSGAPLVLVPDGGGELLRRELELGFSSLGFRVRRVNPDELISPQHANFLPRLLDLNPALFFSVNLQGLLPGGEIAGMLAESSCKTVVWFVDNPWHLLSGMRSPVWKKFTLAVTDASFIKPLKGAGVSEVLHLPLAACPVCMDGGKPEDGGFFSRPLAGVVFAGRSSFPGKDLFFAGQSLPAELLDEASAMSLQGVRPDFAWWVRKLDLPENQENFWPGKKSRLPGLGAVESNRIWRQDRLRSLLPDLTVFGDKGWLQALGAFADLRPPFDYYARMPRFYRLAPVSLNLNSLLLPSGLTQRIFDSWTAGGFCLTDNSPGLDIFPQELTRPITFSTPEELRELASAFKTTPGLREELRRAWRDCILENHTYAARLRFFAS